MSNITVTFWLGAIVIRLVVSGVEKFWPVGPISTWNALSSTALAGKSVASVRLPSGFESLARSSRVSRNSPAVLPLLAIAALNCVGSNR